MAGLLFAGFWVQIPAVLGTLLVAKLVWDVLLSPLRAFDGPLLAKFTNIWRAWQAFDGHIDQTYIQLHRRYGSVVRVGPNALSISDPSMIRVIYSTRNPWKKVGTLFPAHLSVCQSDVWAVQVHTPMSNRTR